MTLKLRDHQLFAECLAFCRKMNWHLAFQENVNAFKQSAYRNAADALQAHGTMSGIETLKGIGKSIKSAFDEIASGKVPQQLKEVEVHGPPYSVSELTRIAGVGPKTAEKLYRTYNVKDLKDMDKKIRSHEISDPKLISAYYDMDAVSERVPRELIARHIGPVLTAIREVIGDAELEVVGSYRRHRPDLRDIDVLIGSDDKATMRAVVAVAKTFASSAKLVDRDGNAKAEIQIEIAGRQRKLDLYFINPNYWGSALIHFTGPLTYNILLRKLAKSKKLKVSQYGIKNTTTNRIRRFKTEQAFCDYLGVPYLDPELRDLFGRPNDVKSNVKEPITSIDSCFCDLHVHTVESDGKATLQGLTKHLLSSRIRCLGVSNHSPGSGSGMPENKMIDFAARLRAARNIKTLKPSGKTKSAVFLCGAEVDIKSDCTLDYSDKALQELDYVILSIHHNFDFKPTQRLLAGLEITKRLKLPTIIAHPTNRIIGLRSQSLVTWNEVFDVCAENNVALEINGQGDRVDLPEELIVRARNRGCIFTVSSDLHGLPSTRKEQQERAIMQARRAWLTNNHIINSDIGLFKMWLGSQRFDSIFKTK